MSCQLHDKYIGLVHKLGYIDQVFRLAQHRGISRISSFHQVFYSILILKRERKNFMFYGDQKTFLFKICITSLTYTLSFYSCNLAKNWLQMWFPSFRSFIWNCRLYIEQKTINAFSLPLLHTSYALSKSTQEPHRPRWIFQQ